MSKPRDASVNVGIDVGKHQLDVFIHERARHFHVTNDAAGTRYLLGRLGESPRDLRRQFQLSQAALV